MSRSIAIVTSTYKNITSGVGTYANILVDALIESGNKVYIISPDCDEKLPYFIKVKTPKISLTPNRWFELSIKYSQILKRLENKVQIVHFLDAREALFFRKQKDIFLLGTVHDTYSWDLQSQSILKRHFFDWKKRLIYYYFLHKFEKNAYKKFDLLLSNTDYVKERLHHFYDIHEYKVKTVHLPAPMEIVNPASYNKIELKDKYIISFVGGNFQRKGLIRLIEAVKELKKEGYNFKIVVAGKDKNQKLIEKWMKERCLNDIVEFKGHLQRDGIKKIMIDSDIFAMPSITEAFGLVYLEAMALGIPVIGTKKGGVKEIINDGVNGFLCDPENINDITDKIKKSLNQEIRKKIIENGFETVKKFSKKRFIDEMLKVYEHIG